MLTKPGDLPPFSVPKLTKQLSLSQGCQKMLSAPFRAKNIVLHIGFFLFSSRLPKFGQKITLVLSVSSCGLPLCMSLCVLTSSNKDPGDMGLRPQPNDLILTQPPLERLGLQT